MMDSRRWQSPAATAAAAAAEEEGADNNQIDQHESLEVTHQMQSQSTELITPYTAVNNKASLLLDGDFRNQNGAGGLAEIENIIKQKHFSRQFAVAWSLNLAKDETEHLIKIMRSRTPDLCNEDQGVPRSSSFETNLFSDKWSTPAKQIDIRSPCGTDVIGSSNVLDVASPIEVAKAYMEAQTSSSVQESQKRKFRALRHGVETENSSSIFHAKVATDSPVCWPSSIVPNYTNYRTPQSNKGKILPPTSSRTTVFPQSNKHIGNRDAYINSSGRPQLSTPFSGGSKALLENKNSLIGGVLGAQTSTYSKGANEDTIGATTPLFTKEGSAYKIIGSNLQEPHVKGIIESGSALGCVSMVDNLPHSESFALSVHPKSTKTAHKILQHLERTIPSPTTKALELRWSSAKRTTPHVVTNSQHKGPDSTTTDIRINDSGSAQQEILDANKVVAPPISPNAVESSPKIQNSDSKSEIAEIPSSQHTSKSDSASTSAAEVSDKSTGNGFSFTFPVPKTSISLPDPPPTPTLLLPPSIPSADTDIPKFTFGSPSTTGKLVFSFDVPSSSGRAEEAVPTFKFGSDTKRELSFDVVGKDAVCF
uniref:Uncharacterized protein n=1 Tax=Leersia perrieri TaxID=77586 RepID=A0A0D9WRY2_9ORYZ